MVCRPLSGRRQAGTSIGTLVENANGVTSSAEAKPSIRETSDNSSMAEITSTRWWTHLGDRQPQGVACH